MNIQTICTHHGRFHTDDIFAVALLLKKYPEAKVIRSREQTDFDNSDIVVDVGLVYDPDKLRFDHHQRDGAGAHLNGIKYSGFGLIWKHYGLEFCGGDQDVWQRIDESLVTSIDANDNGQVLYTKNEYDTSPYTLDSMFELFNPAFDEDLDRDAQFMKAVNVAQQVLERVLIRTISSIKGDRAFVEAYESAPDKRAVVLDKYFPISKVTDDMPELLYVIFPDAVKGWRIKAVRAPDQMFINRKSLPQSWCGLQGDELVKISGISDITFCHSDGFIGGALSKEGALKMLEIALAN